VKPGTHDPAVTKVKSEALLRTVHIRSVLDASSAAALARRAALAIGLEGAGPWSVAIAASELATNITRHAHAGELRIYAGQSYLKLVAEERGPGGSEHHEPELGKRAWTAPTEQEPSSARSFRERDLEVVGYPSRSFSWSQPWAHSSRCERRGGAPALPSR